MYCSATTWQDYYPNRTTREKDQEIRHTVRVVTPPASEPVTIAEAKAQLNIGASDDSHDTELSALIAAAREEWERDTSTALITRTLELTVRPVVSISSVKYIDTAGTEQTVSAADYYLDDDQLWFKNAFVFPTTEERSEAVRITYIAGYGADSLACPELDRMAIKMSLANRFEIPDMIGGGANNREAYENLVRKKMRASYP